MSGAWLASYVMMWVLLLLLVVGMITVARQIGLIHKRLIPVGARMEDPGPAIGDEIDTLDAIDLSGRPLSLGSERGKATLMLFVSPGCNACGEIVPSLRSIARSERKSLEIVLASLGNEKQTHAMVSDYRLKGFAVTSSPELGERFNITTAPYAVLIDKDNVVRARGTANHLEHLESMLNTLEVGHPTIDSLMREQPPGTIPVEVVRT